MEGEAPWWLFAFLFAFALATIVWLGRQRTRREGRWWWDDDQPAWAWPLQWWTSLVTSAALGLYAVYGLVVTLGP